MFLILPRDAVVREGPEAFVFKENGDEFLRQAVNIVAEDRTSVALAADGSLVPGLPLAVSAAASLNRVLKAKAGGAGHEQHSHDH